MAKKFGSPPQLIISEYASAKTKRRVDNNAAKSLVNFLTMKKNGIAIIVDTMDAAIFKAINSFVNLSSISRKRKNKGGYLSPKPVTSFPCNIFTMVR